MLMDELSYARLLKRAALLPARCRKTLGDEPVADRRCYKRQGMLGMDVEAAFRGARSGDVNAFATWMDRVEIPLRRSLSRIARMVDVEVVVQETFLRMWLLACDPGRVLEGDQSSLKFAYRVARNVAFEEIRRNRRGQLLSLDELDDLPEGRVEPDPPDPALERMIRECLKRLPAKPASALSARIRDGSRPDRALAGELHMKLNTFLQNIVRARKLMRDCLERRGLRVEEILS
jgi:DNA-directed RNA polymerase specialized sigma24 family protein